MICALCGKKQSAFSSSYLKDNIMICSECQNMISTLSQTDDMEVYQNILSELQVKCTSYGPTPEAQKALDEILSNIHIKQAPKIEKGEYKTRLSHFLSTTGYELSGYKIIKYIKVISAETVLGTGFLSEFTASISDFFGVENNKFADKLDDAREASIIKIAEKADKLGANALIGMNFNYVNFSGNIIGVVINATAVYVEEITKNADN